MDQRVCPYDHSLWRQRKLLTSYRINDRIDRCHITYWKPTKFHELIKDLNQNTISYLSMLIWMDKITSQQYFPKHKHTLCFCCAKLCQSCLTAVTGSHAAAPPPNTPPPSAVDFCSHVNFSYLFRFGRDCYLWHLDCLIRFWSISIMNMTLNF